MHSACRAWGACRARHTGCMCEDWGIGEVVFVMTKPQMAVPAFTGARIRVGAGCI